jgi:hypothetical protein
MTATGWRQDGDNSRCDDDTSGFEEICYNKARRYDRTTCIQDTTFVDNTPITSERFTHKIHEKEGSQEVFGSKSKIDWMCDQIHRKEKKSENPLPDSAG